MKISLSKLPIILSLLALCACALNLKPAAKPAEAAPLQPAAPLVAEAVRPIPKGLIPADAPNVKIALLLPLSGDSATIGNSMLDAATMALSDSYLTTPSERIQSRIVLIPKDTGSTPAEAAAAAKQAIEEGATFIVGPLFSQAVTAVMPVARAHKTPVLSFSNNRAVAAKDSFTFGFLPEQQVNRMAEYAYLHSLTRVAALMPNDVYGQKIRDTLSESYAQKGGTIAPVELYAPSVANIDAAVSRLVSANGNLAEERRFQAIYIADNAKQMKHIVAALKKYNVDLTKIKLLGTGLWDDPEIAQMPEMKGAWFPSSPPAPYHVFERRFKATYGYDPVRLTSLSYDAVTLIASLVMPTNGAQISPNMLTPADGFIGPANALYRLKKSGESERKLAILEVEDGDFKVIDVAMQHF